MQVTLAQAGIAAGILTLAWVVGGQQEVYSASSSTQATYPHQVFNSTSKAHAEKVASLVPDSIVAKRNDDGPFGWRVMSKTPYAEARSYFQPWLRENDYFRSNQFLSEVKYEAESFSANPQGRPYCEPCAERGFNYYGAKTCGDCGYIQCKRCFGDGEICKSCEYVECENCGDMESPDWIFTTPHGEFCVDCRSAWIEDPDAHKALYSAEENEMCPSCERAKISQDADRYLVCPLCDWRSDERVPCRHLNIEIIDTDYDGEFEGGVMVYARCEDCYADGQAFGVWEFEDYNAESFEVEYYVHSPDEFFGPYYNLQDAEDAIVRLEGKGIEILGISRGKDDMMAESFGGEGDIVYSVYLETLDGDTVWGGEYYLEDYNTEKLLLDEAEFDLNYAEPAWRKAIIIKSQVGSGKWSDVKTILFEAESFSAEEPKLLGEVVTGSGWDNFNSPCKYCWINWSNGYFHGDMPFLASDDDEEVCIHGIAALNPDGSLSKVERTLSAESNWRVVKEYPHDITKEQHDEIIEALDYNDPNKEIFYVRYGDTMRILTSHAPINPILNGSFLPTFSAESFSAQENLSGPWHRKTIEGVSLTREKFLWKSTYHAEYKGINATIWYLGQVNYSPCWRYYIHNWNDIEDRMDTLWNDPKTTPDGITGCYKNGLEAVMGFKKDVDSGKIIMDVKSPLYKKQFGMSESKDYAVIRAESHQHFTFKQLSDKGQKRAIKDYLEGWADGKGIDLDDDDMLTEQDAYSALKYDYADTEYDVYSEDGVMIISQAAESFAGEGDVTEDLAEVRTDLSQKRTNMSAVRTVLSVVGLFLVWDSWRWSKEERKLKGL